MWQFKSHNDRALYLWDYFAVSQVPGPGEARDWNVIARALGRVHQEVIYFEARQASPNERLGHARRIMASLTRALKHLPRIAHVEPWVHIELATLATFVTAVIASAEGDARRVVVN